MNSLSEIILKQIVLKNIRVAVGEEFRHMRYHWTLLNYVLLAVGEELRHMRYHWTLLNFVLLAVGTQHN